MTFIEEVQMLHDSVDGARKQVIEVLYLTLDELRANVLSDAELADAGFLMREAMEAAERARKDLRARMLMISTMLAARLAERCMTQPEADMKTSGELASARADVKVRPIFPKRDDEDGWAEAMRWLQIPKTAWPYVSASYKGVSEKIQEYVEEGRENEIPKSIGTFDEPVVTYVKKRKAR